GTPIKSLKYY
ncbi:hypothetical protein MK534_03780, partial [Streptococcus gallolyticus subsp. gallolyticus]|nr:hypothetical protein [Streptococcus gallolyticus subsp. gallolyticus]